MPIYEYQCGDCGHQLETMQSFSEAPLTDCPACHQSSLKKLISNTSFQLKGTGWYVTDIRDKGKPKPATDTASGTKDTQSSNDTVADAGKGETGTGTSDSGNKAAGST